MSRSIVELEELVRALEIVWVEQSERAHAFQQEASSLWRERADQDRIIAELRRKIETLQGSELPFIRPTLPESAAPTFLSNDSALSDRLASQREAISQRKFVLASL